MSSQMVLFGQPLIKISKAIWQMLRNLILSSLYHHNEILSVSV